MNATRTELAKALGRNEFTVQQMSDRIGVSVEAARSRLARYVASGLVEQTPHVLQYVDDEGRALRGRPAHLYKVR
jgi:predicted ArsR family transcriptional regulator